MKEFDFRKYLKHNPLMEDMRDLAKRPQSLLTKHRPEASDEFWQRVTDDATAQFPDHAEEIESITFGDADRAMKRYEIERDVDGAVAWVLDSLELGEPGGGITEKLSQTTNVISIDLDMGWDDSDPEEDKAAKAAFKKYRIKVSEIEGNPGTFKVTGTKKDILNYLKSDFYDMDQEDIQEYYPELLSGGDSISEADSMIFDKGWEYDDDDEDDDGSDYPDERERFLGLGGQEILDGIKFLIDDGFELEDIMKQIKQHSNYLQGPTMNEGMNDDDSLFGPNIEKSRPGNLSDYYRNAEPPVKQVASQIDKVLEGVGMPEEELINLTDLIIDLSDAYAEERIDLYNSDNSFNENKYDDEQEQYRDPYGFGYPGKKIRSGIKELISNGFDAGDVKYFCNQSILEFKKR